MKSFILLFILSLLSVSVLADKKVKKKISSSDLNTKYEIIGPLGKPLGELINVKAKVLSDPGKGFSRWLEVTSVDDKKLKKPVKIHYEILYRDYEREKKLKTGQVYNLRAYQDGGMIGVPHQAMKETVFMQTWGYHFATKLIIIKIIKSAQN